MTQEKPSRNEDEYFAKLDAEKLQKKKAEMEAAAKAVERKSHYLKCPKCGGDLATEVFHKVQIERCPECAGIWLDAGEVDAVIAHDDQSLMRRVFMDMMTSLRGGEKE